MAGKGHNRPYLAMSFLTRILQANLEAGETSMYFNMTRPRRITRTLAAGMTAFALAMGLAATPARAQEEEGAPEFEQVVITETLPSTEVMGESAPEGAQSEQAVSEVSGTDQESAPSEDDFAQSSDDAVAVIGDGSGIEDTPFQTDPNDTVTLDDTTAPNEGAEQEPTAGDALPGNAGPESGQENAVPPQLISQETAVAEETTGDDLPAAPAKAVAPNMGTCVLQSEIAGNRVIQAKAVKSGSGLVAAAYSRSKNQKWVLVREGGTLWYRVLCAANEKLALVVSSDASGNKVVKLTSAAAAAKGSLLKMLWSFVDVGKGARQLVNASAPELRLEIDKASAKVGVVAAKAASAKSQRIKVLNAKPKVKAGATVDEGSYLLKLSGSSLVTEVDEQSATNGVDAKLGSSKGSATQRIYLERTNDGYYVAWVLGTGKVLDVAPSSILSGTNVRQWTYSGGSRQKWALTAIASKNGSVKYRLQNKATGLYLGAASSKAGVSLTGRADGEANRSFELEQVSLMGRGIYALTPQGTRSVAVQVRKQSTKTAGLVLWVNNGSLGQRFELVPSRGADLWRIRTGSSGGWLTWAGGSKVVQKGSSKTAASSANTWHAIWQNGGVVFVNLACENEGSRLALDTSRGRSTKGTAVVVRRATGVVSQHFSFEPAQLLNEGYYFLQNGKATYLQVKGSSIQKGAPLQAARKTGGLGQLFHVEHKGDYVRIQNVYSGKYLQIASNASGARVTQRPENTSKKQLWKSSIVDGGFVSLASAANPSLALEAGTDVHVAPASAESRQAWKTIGLSDAFNTAKTSRQMAVVRACHTTPSPGRGYCAAWVSSVIDNAGIGSWNGDACDLYANWCSSTDFTRLRPGMIVAVGAHSHTPAGRIWGHVAIYVGNGKVMDNVGSIRTMSLFDWIAWYGDIMYPKWGWLGGAQLS